MLGDRRQGKRRTDEAMLVGLRLFPWTRADDELVLPALEARLSYILSESALPPRLSYVIPLLPTSSER